MSARQFELFGCHLGNGLTVCNKAVMEHGDYKVIAHISNGGNIKWYIYDPESYVPKKDMKTIKRWAESARKEFLETWNTYSDLKKYGIIIENISTDLFLEFISGRYKELDLHNRVKEMEKIYLERYA